MDIMQRARTIGQRGWTWYRAASRRTRVIIAVVVVIVVCGALGEAVGAGGNTSAPTVARATATATATAEPKPTATATPKPTLYGVVSQVSARAGLYGNFATGVKTDLNTSTRTATVTVTLGETFDYNTGVTTVKTEAFQVQHDLWTNAQVQALGGLAEVDVVVLGPVTDQYGNSSTGKYGEADLTAATANLFNWGNLTFDTAWPDYDYTWLIPNTGG